MEKLIKEWTDDHQVGIWENCRWSIRVYEDRTIYKDYTVKWCNNSGSLATTHKRFTGSLHQRLIMLAREEIENDADYMRKAYELVQA
jgi:hypothetical protein